MFFPALQMTTNDMAFWTMVMTIIIAASFVVIAVAMLFIAVFVSRAVRAVARVEQKVEPLAERFGALAEQVSAIAVQGKEVAAQVTVMSGHLSTATLHFSESMALIRDEVRDLKEVVGLSTETARDKIEKISRSIDETHEQLMTTTNFITSKIVNPARELAAIMAGIRRGLEVLVAPPPKQINESYSEEEMFIG
jgi:uncharacterized protein YoxC